MGARDDWERQGEFFFLSSSLSSSSSLFLPGCRLRKREEVEGEDGLQGVEKKRKENLKRTRRLKRTMNRR